MSTDRRVKGLPAPDISVWTFLGYLAARNSPVTPAEASAVYAYCVKRQVSPAFLLGMFTVESQCGTLGTATQTRSWGNTRSPSFGGVAEVGQVAGRSGTFPVFRTWVDGGISTIARLCDYAPYAGKDTVEQIIPVWAPASDLNDPAGYAQRVLAIMARLTAQEQTVSVPKPPMTILDSPNRDGYPGTRHVEAIVWHITEGTDSRGWLTSPASKVSSNYLVSRDGTINQLVPPDQDAWANGIVKEPNTTNPLIRQWQAEGVNFNQRTVSIEHEGHSSHNKGGSLTLAQTRATIALTAWLCDQYGIAPDQEHILGHYEIDLVDKEFCPGFSAAEWNTWVGQVAALVQGTAASKPIVPPADESAPAPPAAPDADPGQTRAYLNDAGEAIVEINFGGKATKIEGYIIADAGVTVANGDTEYSRSIKTTFQPWVKH